jgi:restriction system protein
MTAFLVGIVSLCIGFLVGRIRRTRQENQGEAAVRSLLSDRFSSTDYHLLNNVTLPDGDGTTQIDHVLVSRYGIFVLEAKHYTGWLFGNATAANWTQVIYGKHYKFQNPVRQNYKHVKAIQQLLDFVPADGIHSIVVFSGDAIFKTPRVAGVVALGELVDHVQAFSAEVLSANRVQFCVGRIECVRKALTRQTDVEHVAHLQRKYGGQE